MKSRLEAYFDRLFPIPRSLTGNGVRDSLRILGEVIDLDIKEIPTGTQVLDWTIPKEWNVREAYITTPGGKRIADFKTNNLHLVGYSIPFEGKLSFEDLRKHIITRPDYPEAIPYAASYYAERWGFCLSHNEFQQLPQEGLYQVKIDATLADGSMTVGEAVLKGSSEYEVLFTSYVCHPSMANNELSGPLAIAFLYEEIKRMPNRRLTYRFFLGPETIGAIYYLSKHGDRFKKYLEAGVVVTCCGDRGNFTFKRTREESYLNRLVPHLLHHKVGKNHGVKEFVPMGSDERQYGSPGFNLPVGSLSRTMHGKYKEYHTSKDDKSVIDFGALEETVQLLADLVRSLELEGKYINLNPKGEPQLGRRGLYPSLMSDLNRERNLEHILYLLNYADSKNDLLSIASRMEEPILAFLDPINSLIKAGLLRKDFARIHGT
jgi:aminopeptidase-like protein